MLLILNSTVYMVLCSLEFSIILYHIITWFLCIHEELYILRDSYLDRWYYFVLLVFIMTKYGS
jgi:hypothetical protein